MEKETIFIDTDTLTEHELFKILQEARHNVGKAKKCITRKEYAKVLVNLFLAVLEEYGTQWIDEWNIHIPYNMKNNAEYIGINRLYLKLTMIKEGFTDSRWLTANQIKALGYQLMKEKGTEIEYWFPFDVFKRKMVSWDEWKEKTNGNVGKQYIFRPAYITVYNATFIKGMEN